MPKTKFVLNTFKQIQRKFCILLQNNRPPVKEKTLNLQHLVAATHVA